MWGLVEFRVLSFKMYSPGTFRRHLKTHYFSKPSNPLNPFSLEPQIRLFLTTVRVYKLYTYLLSVLWHHCWLGVRKASGLQKLSDGVLVRLSVWSEVQIVCIWSTWCHCHPKTPASVASFKSRLVLPFWYRLTQVVLEKRPLNGCSSSTNLLPLR